MYVTHPDGHLADHLDGTVSSGDGPWFPHCEWGTREHCAQMLTQRPLLAHADCVEVGEVAAQAERSTSPDPAVGLRAVVRLRRLAAQLEADQVAAVRRAGWASQGIALGRGVTKQSVHRKYIASTAIAKRDSERPKETSPQSGWCFDGRSDLLVGSVIPASVSSTCSSASPAVTRCCHAARPPRRDLRRVEDTARAAAPLGVGAAAELSRSR